MISRRLGAYLLLAIISVVSLTHIIITNYSHSDFAFSNPFSKDTTISDTSKKQFIYTYYDKLDSSSFGPDELELLELWKKSWSAYGWTPVILSQNEARQHPKFEEYSKVFKSFDFVNDQSYELACYYRWIAMIVVGGGFMSDIDVMNYGFRYPEKWDWKFTTHQVYVPAFVSASKEEYQRVVDLLVSYNSKTIPTIIVNGKPHTSDMVAFKKMSEEGKIHIDEIVSGNIPTNQLVHWSHNEVFTTAGKVARAPFLLKARKDPLWNP
jgi:hypothetical protein